LQKFLGLNKEEMIGIVFLMVDFVYFASEKCSTLEIVMQK